ncbi:LON peptidase substrate-binding domain-containing protein [Ferrovibrio sp.]|uniref:LON peptidase substrate-binding domain-containing protein n=1 Tax=Ferrovibrio sp. TaxID=1917215 RepID=UPI0025BC3F72|nr:LON peptidase substrate-binding domain-containing protein [Ferrovibrio sp.]MBX3456538.1 LON peptidase substrate-binding domain-containing protein [Ferrovibrio sp.]
MTQPPQSEQPEPQRAGALPAHLPIFPLTGVLLLPRGLLPLNIFEPRYLAMTRAALAGDKLIGMVQPRENEGGKKPAVYHTGCAGEIVSATDTDDGRILITLRGICRFDIAEELETTTSFRQVRADFAGYKHDLLPAADGQFDRSRMLKALRGFLDTNNLAADWPAIEATPDELLVHSLAMICPFAPAEKQAFLDSRDFKHRAELLSALLEMAQLQRPGSGNSLN